jgi:hypothetical protein
MTAPLISFLCVQRLAAAQGPAVVTVSRGQTEFCGRGGKARVPDPIEIFIYRWNSTRARFQGETHA